MSEPSDPSDPSAAGTPTRPCPACGTEWPDEIRFCGACGGRMPDATVVASPYKVQVEATAAPSSGGAVASPSPARAEPDGGLPPESLPPVGFSKIVDIAPATPVLVPPDPMTLETRRDVAVDAIGEAWAIVKHRRGLLALGTIVVGLATSALTGTGIGVLALGPLQGGFAVVALRAASGRRVDFNDFFEGFSRAVWLRLALSALLVGVVVTLGTCALVVPGLYLAMAAVYTPFLVVDRGETPWSALKISVNGVNAQLGAHIVVFLLLGALDVAGSLACGLGLLVTIPLTVVAVGVLYGRVFGFAGGVDRLGR